VPGEWKPLQWIITSNITRILVSPRLKGAEQGTEAPLSLQIHPLHIKSKLTLIRSSGVNKASQTAMLPLIFVHNATFNSAWLSALSPRKLQTASEAAKLADNCEQGGSNMDTTWGGQNEKKRQCLPHPVPITCNSTTGPAWHLLHFATLLSGQLSWGHLGLSR
jgi:hypothetical protein